MIMHNNNVKKSWSYNETIDQRDITYEEQEIQVFDSLTDKSWVIWRVKYVHIVLLQRDNIPVHPFV